MSTTDILYFKIHYAGIESNDVFTEFMFYPFVLNP